MKEVEHKVYFKIMNWSINEQQNKVTNIFLLNFDILMLQFKISLYRLIIIYSKI